MRWQDSIAQDIREKVDIDGVAREFDRLIKRNIADDNPPEFSTRKARQEMLAKLDEKGVKRADATLLLHKSGVVPYSGCGCCEHRKKEVVYVNY